MPLTAVLAVTEDEYQRGLNIFQTIMAILAWASLAQMAVQIAVGGDWMFPLDQVLPETFFISNFNLRIPITEGEAYLKSTGLVFQFLHLSLVGWPVVVGRRAPGSARRVTTPRAAPSQPHTHGAWT
jgi:hypothetical protein